MVDTPVWELTFQDSGRVAHWSAYCWKGVSGYAAPAFVTLQEHGSAAQCELAFRTTADTERGESWLIRPFPGQPWRPIPDAPLVELGVREVYNGAQAAYASGFEQHLAPEYRKAGASISSLFEIVIGPRRPTLILFAGWPDLHACSIGRRAIDVSSAHAAKLAADRERFGRTIEMCMEAHLLRPWKGDG